MKLEPALRALLATLLVAGACGPVRAVAPQGMQATGVTMGSVAMDIPVEMIKRMSALSNHLALSTNLNIRFRPSPNLGSAVEDLGTGQTQIAYLTPVAYIEARKKYGVIPLVAPTADGRQLFPGGRRQGRFRHQFALRAQGQALCFWR